MTEDEHLDAFLNWLIFRGLANLHEDQIVFLYEMFSRGKTIIVLGNKPPTVLVCEYSIESIKKD